MVNDIKQNDEIVENVNQTGVEKMDKYEQLSIVGEGSYGLVMKCRHKETDTMVAIKKFLETEEDATVRKMALREIRMLKKLKHENLVAMIDVFRNRKRFYIVFEYVEGTILDELEKNPTGLSDEQSRERIFQVTRAVQFCHINHIIHRDVKPENILISSRGIIKLCDFGFARLISNHPDAYTEYVATRWYRAPELLVGEAHYGPPVDVWAIGCLFSEMMTGEPLFPGDSDIDQLYLIIKLIGKPCTRHQQLMLKNTHFRSIKKSPSETSLYKLFPNWSLLSLDFLTFALKMDPMYRPSADELLKHNYFHHDRFADKFLPALKEKVRQEYNENPLLRKYKADVLLAEAQRKELQKREARRSTTVHESPPKWKIQFVQESIKRKLSSEFNAVSEVSLDNSKNYINTNRLGQKYSVNKLNYKTTSNSNSQVNMLKRADDQHKATGSEPNITKYTNYTPKFYLDKTTDTSSTSKFNTSQKENPRLEKAIELLTKLNQKNQYRPKSSNKDTTFSSNILSPSPQDFQSLQPQSCREPLKSPVQPTTTNILHPTITNINHVNLNQNNNKQSPYLTQSINNVSLKSIFNQVPLTNPPKIHHLKRLDRSVIVDSSSSVNLEKTSRFKSPPDWLTSIGIPQVKKETKSGKSGDFTLPTVPGATGSPAKSKKKLTPDHASNTQTPKKIVSCGDLNKRVKFITLNSSP